jgi:hypothetical protein
MLTLGIISENQSYGGLMVQQLGNVATSARLVRRLMYTTPSLRESGVDTGLYSFRHIVQGFRQQFLFEMTLLMLRAS